MTLKQTQLALASWRNSAGVCAFSDAERHLGHIIRAGSGWLAFDATHLASSGSTFRSLGFFPSVADARAAVQSATGSRARVA